MSKSYLPDPAAKIWLNGSFVPPEQATVNVYDHGVLYGDGVFEGMRFYNRRIFKLHTHMKRLYDSAKAIRLDIPYPLDELEQAVRDTVAANGHVDGYIRLVCTRGGNALGLNPFVCTDPVVFIIAGQIALYPEELYTTGLKVITSSVIRNHPAALSPRIKSLNYLNNILAKIEAIDAGCLEAVMLNHMGFVAECTGDNIFIVRQQAGETVLATPPLHAGILEGVTMNAVLGLARAASIKVQQVDMTKHDLYVADEMFLTGSAAEVIPVTSIDGRTIGDGSVGPVTEQLRTAFRELVAKNAPED